MSEHLSFSIIIPVYNSEEYLGKCLESVLRQTYDTYEVICINDGSTDGSLQILNEFQKRDPRIHVSTIDNSGPGTARNTGIKLATGDYILFLDSDDYLSKDALRVLNRKITSRPETDIVTFGAHVLSDDDLPIWLLESTTSKNAYFSGNAYELLFSEKVTTPFVWNKAYKKSLLDKNKITFHNDIKLGEDKLFLYDAFIAAKHVSFISDALYNYRWQRQDSIMTSFKKDKTVTTQNHLRMILAVLDTLVESENLDYRIDDTLQWMVALLYYSSFKELPEKEQIPIATEFSERYEKYDINKRLNFYYWDDSNAIALSNILSKATTHVKPKISIIMHENHSYDYAKIVNSFLKQKNITSEVIIICFTVAFYNFINFRYGSNCRVFLFPHESFIFAKNFGIKMSTGEYVMFPSYSEPLRNENSLAQAVSAFENNQDAIASIYGVSNLSAGTCFLKNAGHDDLSPYLNNLSSVIFKSKDLQSRVLRFRFAGGYEDPSFIINALLHKPILLSNVVLQAPFQPILFYDDSWFETLCFHNANLQDHLSFIISVSKAIIFYNDIDFAKTLVSPFAQNDDRFFHLPKAITPENKDVYADAILLYPILSLLKNDPQYKPLYEIMINIVALLEEYDEKLCSELAEQEQLINNIRNPKIMKRVEQIHNSFAAKLYRKIKK